MSERTRRVALSGLLTALMVILGYFDSAIQIPIPIPVPGIKLGLANSVLLYSVYMMGIGQTLILMVLKVLITGFMFGNPQMMTYSFMGGLLSVLMMLLVRRIRGVSVIGTSVVGAAFHNVGQILVAALQLKLPELFTTYLPILLVVGVVTGVLTGIIAQMVMKHLKHMPQARS